MATAKPDTDSTASNLRARVLALVAQVPAGKVASYGQIAALAGHPHAARQVGAILRGLHPDTTLPWQRIINAQGGISTYKVGSGELQRALLEREGIVFDSQGRCDLRRYAWKSPAISLFEASETDNNTP